MICNALGSDNGGREAAPLFTAFAGNLLLAVMVLRMELDKVPLWRGEYVAIKQLVDDFARYVYLPRLVDSQVLIDGIADGLALLTWERETFAYADSYDEAVKRYRGLRAGTHIHLNGSTGLYSETGCGTAADGGRGNKRGTRCRWSHLHPTINLH